MATINILIVEDEVIIAKTLEEMLKQLGHDNILKCRAKEEAIKVIEANDIELAILDINLSGEHEGIELGKHCQNLGIPYFFLTSYSDHKTILEAKQAKPGNYVIKPFTPEEILVAIELTLMHQQSDANEKVKKAVDVFKLSTREAEILRLIFQRLSYQEMADLLFLSLNTIKYHLRHIYTKMGASSKQEIIQRIEYVWSQEV